MFAIILIGLNVFIYLGFVLNFLPTAYHDAWTLNPATLGGRQMISVLMSGFVHVDLMHLAMNMLGLWVFGSIVEERLGFWKTLYIYLGSQIVAMLVAAGFYLMLNHAVLIQGASGAVMGLLSASMLLNPFKVTYEMLIPLPVMIKGWLFLSADVAGLMRSEQDGVSHIVHLAGFMSMAVLIYFLSASDKEKMHTGLIINLVTLLVIIFVKVQWL